MSKKKYYRKADVLAIAPFGATRHYDLMQAGKMPKPVAYLGEKTPVWDAAAVDAAIDALIAEHAGAPAPDAPAVARQALRRRRTLQPVLSKAAA